MNDNDPVFDPPYYAASISEAIPIGTVVLRLLATDADSGINSVLRYHIQQVTNSTADDSSYFHISSTLGIVTTKLTLDHEQSRNLHFIVSATDGGMPFPRSATTTVNIAVTDFNDNSPKFYQHSYELSISDQSRRGQFVTIVKATDEDSSDRERLSYAIVDGNQNRMLKIDAASGTITLSKIRRPQLQPRGYRLNVSVTDGAFATYTLVNVNVNASNRRNQAFTQAVYDVSVIENLPVGSFVAVVKMVDLDSESERVGGVGGEFEYRIVGKPELTGTFNIATKTGLNNISVC